MEKKGKRKYSKRKERSDPKATKRFLAYYEKNFNICVRIMFITCLAKNLNYTESRLREQPVFPVTTC